MTTLSFDETSNGEKKTLLDAFKAALEEGRMRQFRRARTFRTITGDKVKVRGGATDMVTISANSRIAVQTIRETYPKLVFTERSSRFSTKDFVIDVTGTRANPLW